MAKKMFSQGLTYKKLDLHIHTPASTCFQGTCTPEEIINRAIEIGLDGIAITDHNTAEWVDRVKAAASKTKLVVFPGVEISCVGGKKNIHIIALFDPSATSSNIITVLNLSGITSGYGQADAVADKAPAEVIKIIHDNGGLAIMAHPNSSSGVLSDMSGQPRLKVIQSEYLTAAEATDFDDQNKRQNHKRVVDLLDGTDVTYQRKLAVYQASDNPHPSNNGQHALAGIGNRVSYFKMEKINLESLRQCFVDPDTRIRQPFTLSALKYPSVNRVSVNSGYFSGQIATFHPGLNSILGAKGAGKSLLIEFMRFALNQEPTNESIRSDHLSKLRAKLGDFGKVEVAFVDENGKETVIRRTFNELDESPYDETVPFDPSQIFPVLFLSQNEIIAIAENETCQLQFIDRFFDFHSYRTKIASIEKELIQLDKTMAEGLRAYSEYDDLQTKIQTLNKEIEKIDLALKNPIFEKYVELEKKDKLLKSQQAHIQSYIENIVKTRDSLIAMHTPSLHDSIQSDPVIKRGQVVIEKIRESAAESFAGLIRELHSAQEKLKQEYKAWQHEYETGKKEYEQYIQDMGGDYKALAVSRERFSRQRGMLQSQLDAAASKKDLVPVISKRRNDLLDVLQQTYSDYTQERKAKCEKFMRDSGGKLQLTILDQSNVDKFKESLLSLKRGSYLKDEEISVITSTIGPRDFVISLLRYDATKESNHLQNLSKASGIEMKKMKILADFLLSQIPYEELLSLQYKAHPQDRPEILYNIGDGKYESISNISVGQKCTAMLIMALSDGSMPIVIDQPEDSLDIRSIWEDVCLKVRGGKEARQFIFTTHNSSLAVASDTDCYLVIEGNATRGEIVYSGTLDHSPVGEEVMKYLEGGSSTYQLKSRKYSGFKDKH